MDYDALPHDIVQFVVINFLDVGRWLYDTRQWSNKFLRDRTLDIDFEVNFFRW
jgi:hypothetical protein